MAIFETIREAAEAWVREFNAVPQGMIEKLIQTNVDEWHDITRPTVGSRVYHLASSEEGEITNIIHTEDDEYRYTFYEITLDNGEVVRVEEDDEFELIGQFELPMWGTMWSFGDGSDEQWLDDEENLQRMSDCGFKIFESDEFGYFFGIDGAGYDFYESHWIPLYEARGLQWHK